MKNKVPVYFFVVFLIAFALNLVWEFAHSPLYDWNTAPLRPETGFYISRILLSTLGDGVLMILIFAFTSLINKTTQWIENPRATDYLLISALGLVLAVLIEIKAKVLNQWTYTNSMPTIAGIGISPLLQLALTGMLTAYLAKGAVKLLTKNRKI